MHILHKILNSQLNWIYSYDRFGVGCVFYPGSPPMHNLLFYLFSVVCCVRGGVLDVTPLLSGGYYTVPLDSLGIPPVVVLHRVMGVIS